MIKEPFQRHGLTFFPTKGMTREQWLRKRDDGIGGSDVSSILGLNPRFSAIELFYQKLGMVKTGADTNNAIFFGNRLEDVVLDVGQYLDFNTGQYIDNYETGTKLRRITKFKYMVNNPRWPWLLGNIDGAVNFRARQFKIDGPAEAKTISRQTAEKWVSGIPPYHIIQINVYMLALAPAMVKDHACLLYLEDGREYRGYQIPRSESVCDRILTETEKFWQRVVKGREICAEISDYDTRLKYLAEIEPEPDDTESYSQFLSELWKRKQDFITVEGDDAVLEHALAYARLGQEINEVKTRRQLHRNHVMKALHDHSANVITFGDQGKITWNKKLYCNLKGVAVEE